MRHFRGIMAFVLVTTGCTGFDLSTQTEDLQDAGNQQESGVQQNASSQQDASTNLYDVSTLAGTGAEGAADGAGSSATFGFPAGVGVGSDGNLYVADYDNNIIRMITPNGTVSTFAGTGRAGFTNGNCATATFNEPASVAVDAAGNVYVAEYGNHAIRKIIPSPTCQVSTLAGSGAAGDVDSTGSQAAFDEPAGLAIDASGNVYVADYNNNKVRMVTSSGVVSTIAGKGTNTYGHTDGATSIATFDYPFGIAVDTAGTTLYITDDSNAIRKISNGMVSTFAGSGNADLIDGSGLRASFSSPGGLAIDEGGNLFVADSGNNAVRKISPTGEVITIAGTGGKGSKDGPGDTATFNYPWALTMDTSGVIYVADSENNKIRKITPPSP